MQTSSEVKELFGKRLAALRSRAGLTQQELSDAMSRQGHSHSPNALSAWERGVSWPPLLDASFARALASALETTPKMMFSSLGLIGHESDAITPDEMRMLRAYREGDQQALLEIVVGMGRDYEDTI